MRCQELPFAIVAFSALAGCELFGPASIEQGRLNYNEVIYSPRNPQSSGESRLNGS